MLLIAWISGQLLDAPGLVRASLDLGESIPLRHQPSIARDRSARATDADPSAPGDGKLRQLLASLHIAGAADEP